MPSVQIIGYTGPAKVLVSCVEDAYPYRVHPHQIIGKDGKNTEGVITFYELCMSLDLHLYYTVGLKHMCKPHSVHINFRSMHRVSK